MATTVTPDQVLTGMEAAIVGALKPATGDPVTTDKYLRDVGRFSGLAKIKELTEESRGKSPAVQVAFAGERIIRTTVGRRVDYVEGSFDTYCVSDSRKSRDARGLMGLKICNDVRQSIAARRFSLPIKGMRFVETTLALDDEKEKALVYRSRFTSRYHVDYTKQATYETMDSVKGDIIDVNASVLPAPSMFTVTPVLGIGSTQGSTLYVYQVVAEYDDGRFSNPSIFAKTLTGQNPLTVQNYNILEWLVPTANDEDVNVVAYHVYRIQSAGSGDSGTLGKLGSTVELHFNDTGLVGDGNLPALRGDRVDITF